VLTDLIRIGCPRIVNQDIEPAKLVKRQVDHRLPVLSAGDILFLKNEIGRILRCDLLAGLDVDVGQDDLGAFIAEARGDGGAKAGSSSC
jgi:hypothetical protein